MGRLYKDTPIASNFSDEYGNLKTSQDLQETLDYEDLLVIQQRKEMEEYHERKIKYELKRDEWINVFGNNITGIAKMLFQIHFENQENNKLLKQLLSEKEKI